MKSVNLYNPLENVLYTAVMKWKLQLDVISKNFCKVSYAVIYERAKQPRLFVSDMPFQSSLIFASKPRVYPSGAPNRHFRELSFNYFIRP
jgi:hypothetical protein